ncbi:MAG: FkbM family methyltransferase [Candidatus Gracilibacteria bacterium]|jgi:FkbM family methyltransferase|nr:FkbM family methyltransferase [Candidatus Gracilibacteria bacterium]
MAYPYKNSINLYGKHLEILIRSDADASVYFEVFEDKEYSVLDPIIKNAKLPIIDIGAHTGMFSLYASILNDKVPIYAYEPDPENFKTLKSHFTDNRIFNVYPKNLAVSSITGQRVLFLKTDSHNHSLISDENDEKEQKIFTSSISQILEKVKEMNDTDTCELLKLDAEGVEFEIFEKAEKRQIRAFNNIYMEYHELNENMRGEDIRRILEKSSFKTKILPSKYDSRFGFIFAKKI